MTFGAPYTVLGSRLVVLIAGVLAVAASAFVFTVALVATVVTTTSDGTLDPGRAANLATPIGFVAAGAATAGVLVARRALWRSKIRDWLPLYEAMVRDANRVVGTSLVEVRRRIGHPVTGRVLAVDIESGWERSLRLPATARARGTVVCLAETLSEPKPMAWMSGALWQACRRLSERGMKGGGPPMATGQGDRWPPSERRLRRAANDAVAAAEEILKQHRR